MKYKMLKKQLAMILVTTMTMSLTACTTKNPQKEIQPKPTNITANDKSDDISENLTLGQVADYFIQVASKYQGETDRTIIMKGFNEKEQATRLEMFVLASRAFGKLPTPTGIAKKIAPPSVDLTNAPEWAKKELKNLSDGGILAASDLDLEEKIPLSDSSGKEDPMTSGNSLEESSSEVNESMDTSSSEVNKPIDTNFSKEKGAQLNVADKEDYTRDNTVNDEISEENPSETNQPADTSIPKNTGAQLNTNKMSAVVSLKDVKIIAARFFRMFGSNLKDDFYYTVNRKDLNTLEVEEGEIFAGGSSKVIASTDRQLHDLILEITESGKEYPEGSPEQKIRDLYLSVLDTERRDQEGIKPLKKYIDLVDTAQNFSELNAAIAQAVNELGNSANSLFAMVPITDTKDSSRYIMQLMTMPTILAKDDYENPEGEVFKEYRESMIKKLIVMGETKKEAEKHVDRIIQMETELAGQTTDPEELGDLQRETKRYTPEILDKLMPQANPSELFIAIGIPQDTEMQVFDEKQFEAFADWFTEENLEIFKSLQKMALITNFCGYLSTELATEFEYSSTVGSDAANNAIQTFLPEELGELYVNRYFSSESKAEIEKIVNMMIDVFKNRIKELEWMEESTKQEALKKLESITVMIGYPDKWEKSEAEIKSLENGGSYFRNVTVLLVEQWKHMIEKLNTPVDPRRFPLTAYTVNAAASRNTNTIIFPAGILQAPFYDKNASFEENLGAIGTTIAHEITHMFDDGGAQYDSNGNVRNWWTDSDYSHFQELCKKVEDFYDGYEAVTGVGMNGKETLSENISDIGGIACALEILSAMENPNYDAFFRSYARQWVRVGSYKDLAEMAESDIHAPNSLRCNRVLANFQEFVDTYDIKPGDGMYVAPEERIKIW